MAGVRNYVPGLIGEMALGNNGKENEGILVRKDNGVSKSLDER